MLKKISRRSSGDRKTVFPALAGAAQALGRREFLHRSGLAAGGLAAAGLVPGGVRAASAAEGGRRIDIERIRTVCTHCSVGCTIIAEVENGVWISQEPDLDHPISLGGHCAKGAAARYDVIGKRRLKRPMKRDGGKWKAIDWDTAIGEIGERLLAIRAKHGPESVYWLGSANLGNEQAYMLRKLAAFWGTNNVDGEGRLFHAAADEGIAQTWGYGAQTNSFNDVHNARSILIVGGSPAEDQPLAMLHILGARERNNAPLIVCAPRFSETAAHADEYVRYRPGTDVALVWGMVREILANGWEDKTFIRQRVGGIERVRGEIERWTPEEVERVSGVPPAQLKRITRLFATNRPGALYWSAPGTQHVLASNNVRAFAILQLVLGNIGVSGGGANGLRPHDNAQGTSDMGLRCDSLPGYYGLDERAWRHWARVWKVDYDYLLKRFGRKADSMQTPGIAGSRWFDGVLEEPTAQAQSSRIRAVMIWGHGTHLTSRLGDMKKALDKLDLIVGIAPYPSLAAVMAERQDGVYLLPSATQYETVGTVTNSSRSVQWRDRVVAPVFESKPDHEIMYLLARGLGFASEMFKGVSVADGTPAIEDVGREANSGLVQIGYSGHSPERIKRHMKNGASFDRRTLRAVGGPVDGEYYGLPWPCWGAPESAHPGTPELFDISKRVDQGGLPFPAIFGLERDGRMLWAQQSFPKGSEIKDGFPEFTAALLKHLTWDRDLTGSERATIAAIEGERTDWRTDLSGGIHRIAMAHGAAPFGNGRARAFVWEAPDPVPLHREPLYTPRRDLVEPLKGQSKRLYPTYGDGTGFRLSTRLGSVQTTDHAAEFPLILTTGRLVEYAGGGDGTRANAWLAELRRRMFVEIHPFDAHNADLGEGQPVWVVGPEGGRIKVAATITRRVGRGVVFLPIHFAGQWRGQSLRGRYPRDADAFVLGDSAGAVMGYGYDPVAQMPETLCGLCRLEKA